MLQVLHQKKIREGLTGGPKGQQHLKSRKRLGVPTPLSSFPTLLCSGLHFSEGVILLLLEGRPRPAHMRRIQSPRRILAPSA